MTNFLGIAHDQRRKPHTKETIPKSIFDVTESGKILLKVMEQAQRAG
ncbi:MAG: hypothetical protein ACRECH_16955 [Nitrososphaerales archaeon]